MLLELRVENLLLIERAELRFGPGLNALTGETGAGKTVLAHALDLLLGGRARSNVVRPGAEEAYVEGIFERPAQLPPELAERLPDDDGELILARRVSREGRTRAYIGGRAAAVGELRALAEGLIAFYGQHEHRKLTLASAQLDILDGFCGKAQAERRAACAAAHSEARALETALVDLRERAGARDRELDLLEFELAEIEQAQPSEAEQRELHDERERLRHLDALRAAALGGADALAPEDAAPGAVSLLAEAERAMEGAAGVDKALDELAERFRGLRVEAEDLARELRRHEQSIDAPEGRLEEVEERLAALDRLQRKHGGSIQGVLAHAETSRARRDELADADVALERAQSRVAAARGQLDQHAQALHLARATAAPKLAAAVRERLGELAMQGASFEIEVAPRQAGPTGADEVEFEIATNPGVPAGPVREIASGGELSRVMLALLSVAQSGGGATLVFDEVDAGIGGQTANAVGERLRALSADRQVLCITHLPQIASVASRHFRIAKDVSTTPARTTVESLERNEVVGELVRMLGGDGADSAAREHALALLDAA